MKNDPSEAERFHANTLVMSELVYESVIHLRKFGHTTVDPLIVELATSVIKEYDKDKLIQGFIENSYLDCWDAIKRRDEKFFVANVSEIFKYLPMEKVNLFKDLFTTVDIEGKSVISQSFKDDLWELFDVMIKISIKYIHKYRDPYSYSHITGIINDYKNEFFEEIDLAKNSAIWNVKLDFPPNCI
jgi:hypothetical protein